MVYIALVIIFVLIWLFFKRGRHSQGKHPPAPPGWPIIGNTLQIDSRGIHHSFYKWAEAYGPIVSCNLMGTETVLLNSPEIILKVFTSEEYGKSAIYKPKTFLGKYVFWDHQNIITDPGTKHVSQRRRWFHTALHFYGEGVNRFEDLVQAELQNITKEIVNLNGADFDPKAIISKSIGNIIACLLSGEGCIHQRECDMIWRYNDAFNLLIDPGVWTVLSTFPFMRNLPGKYRRVFRDCYNARDSLLDVFYVKMKESYHKGSERGLVDYFFQIQEEVLEKGDTESFTDTNIKGLILDVILAGTATTTASILHVILLLLHNQGCAKKMREEIREVLGTEGKPSLEHRDQLPYVQAVILETFRLTALVPFSAPREVNKDMNLEGYTISAGTTIYLNMWYIQHDPNFWEDPWKFRPERFLDGDGLILPPEHPRRQRILQFGIGRRRCIGESLAKSRLFLYIAALYQKFKFDIPRNGHSGSGDVKDLLKGALLLPDHFMVRAVKLQ